ncbi:hypothetical protein ACVW0K_000048 [Streptomyces filamentosus]
MRKHARPYQQAPESTTRTRRAGRTTVPGVDAPCAV